MPEREQVSSTAIPYQQITVFIIMCIIERLDQGHLYPLGKHTGRRMAKVVTRLLVVAVLWVRIQTFLKNKLIGNIAKGCHHTLAKRIISSVQSRSIMAKSLHIQTLTCTQVLARKLTWSPMPHFWFIFVSYMGVRECKYEFIEHTLVFLGFALWAVLKMTGSLLVEEMNCCDCNIVYLCRGGYFLLPTRE